MKSSEQIQMKGKGVEGGAGLLQKLNKDDAEKYINEVKEIFQDQKEKYTMFLEILRDFRFQRTDMDGVVAQVKELFKDHKNLIYGFSTFLPKGYEISLNENEHPPKQNGHFAEAIDFVNKIKMRFQNDEDVYKSFLDIFCAYRTGPKDINDVYAKVASLFQDHHDLLEEFKSFLPGSLPAAHFDQDDNRRDLLQDCSDTLKSPRNIEGLGSSDDMDTFIKGMYKLCGKVRERLGNSDDYLAFLKCLHYYSNEIIKKNDLQNLVTDMLGKYPDLMIEFNRILGALENTESLSGDRNASRPLKLEDEDREEKHGTNGTEGKET